MDFCGPRRGALVVLALTLLWLAGTPPAIAQPDPPAGDNAQAEPAAGVVPARLTPSDMGRPPPAALDAAADLTLSLPLPPGGITGGQLTLHLVPSPQVDARAMVHVSLHGDAGRPALAAVSAPAGELRQKGLL